MAFCNQELAEPLIQLLTDSHLGGILVLTHTPPFSYSQVTRKQTLFVIHENQPPFVTDYSTPNNFGMTEGIYKTKGSKASECTHNFNRLLAHQLMQE